MRTNTIAEIKNGIEFQSFKLGAKEKIQIHMDKKGFNIKLLESGALGSKLKQEFKKVMPIDLHEIINYMIFVKKEKVA